LDEQTTSVFTALPAACFMLVSCLAYFSTLKMEVIHCSETSADFTTLHGIVSQKTEFFRATAVRISNPKTITLIF
jgi:choline-glycine betaine transporter